MGLRLSEGDVANRVLVVLGAVIVVICGFGSALRAEMVIDFDGDVLRDTNTGLVWYRDLKYFAGFDYATQISLIADLNQGDGYFNVKNWHLASTSEMDALWSAYLPEEMHFESSFPMNNVLVCLGRYENAFIGVPPESPFAPSHFVRGYEYYRFPAFDPPYGVEFEYSISDREIDARIGAWVVGDPSFIPQELTVVPLPSAVLLAMIGLGIVRLWRVSESVFS